MDAKRWREVEAVFLAARERDPHARQTFLDEACMSDPALRNEVEDLLKADSGASGFLETPAADPAEPELAGRLQVALGTAYLIERELGGGGMSRVFVATETALHRRVVIKVLPPELAAEVDAERFHREIRLAASLQHPHVVPVHTAGHVGGLLYYTMPFVEGESLRQRLERETPLPLDEVMSLLREITDALAYAHRRGIVHRDLKPANILVEEGHALITDFGIAKAISSAAGAVTTGQSLTSTGRTPGTPAYMAPEQAAGDPIDHRADLYALGCLAYELLSGRPPFTGSSAQALIAAHLADVPEPVSHRRAHLPRALSALVMQLLEKRPEARPQSAEEVLRTLEAVNVRSGGSHSPLELTPGRRRPHAARSVILAIGLLLGLGVLFVRVRPQPKPVTGVVETDLLAVLPFQNTGDSADAYFADGVSDAVRGKLAAVSGLRVIAGASSAAYRGSAKSPEEIAGELGVRYLLMGKVRLERPPGEQPQVRVSPELVEVRGRGPPTTRWQRPFEASLPGVFLVQTDIAQGVAEALGMALDSTKPSAQRPTQTNRQALSEEPTSDPAAYDAYLRAEEISDGLNALAPAVLRRALPYYEQAVELDSTFAQAWAQLGRANAYLYLLGTPDPALASRASEAAERAVAAAPNQFAGRLALGDYYRVVKKDYGRAIQQYELGRQIAPDDVDLLTNSALVEQSLGRWEQALKHLQRAHTLNPRAVLSAQRFAFALLSLRRYPEAQRALEEARALAPSNLEVVQTQAMVYLGQGDLKGAQAVLRSVSQEVEATTVAAYMGYYWDLYWVLEESQQSLLLRLGPSAFEDNRASWALVLAQTYTLRGDTTLGRAYADSARLALEDQLASSPKDAQLRVLHGLALAYLNRKSEAVREGELGAALAPIAQDWYTGSYVQHQLVRIYLLADLPEKALDHLEPLIKGPYYLSPGWLMIDPTFDTLRHHPRFQLLVAG